jgi:hypothetical protein
MRNPRNERVTRHNGAEGPERKCILSGDKASRDALVRLAVSPEGPDGASIVLPDVLARAPGRGAWIGVSRGDLEKAIGKGNLKGALARAFKGARLAIPDDLPERIDAALLRAFTDRLGLELKGGRLVLGSDRIAETARAGRIAWLAHAADASADGSGKLDQAWRVGSEREGSGMAGVRLPLDRAALSVALGRDNVVHLALSDRDAAGRVDGALQRLLHFRGPDQATGTTTEGPEAAGDRAPVALSDTDRARAN